MRKLCVLLLCLFGSFAWAEMPKETFESPLQPTVDEMAKAFADPTGLIQTGCYWYWLSGNSSCEGIEKDIRAMKSVGIDRAQIGDIGVEDIPRGPVRTFSPEWWEEIHTALKTATECGVEIGIFNSPGWSQSGGPWIDHTRAMRYLTGDIIELTGPNQVTFKNSKRTEEFQDVRVLAFPKPKSEVFSFSIPKENLPKGKEASFVLTLEKPITARSLTLQTAETPIDGKGRLEAEIDGKMTLVAQFPVSRYNAELHVGFQPYAPIAISFPEVTSDSFRLTLVSDRDGALIESALLDSAPKVPFYPEKTLAKMHQTPQPMWSEYQWSLPPEVTDSETILHQEKMVDLTDCIDGESITWDVPDGDWLVFWYGMVPTGVENAPAVPEATGYETDKMSKEHIFYHFDSMMGEILRRIPEEDRKSFGVVVLDSYEVGGQNFTDDMIPRFKERFGYDPTRFLPAWSGFVVDDPVETDRFLWDLRRFIADEIAYSYVGGLREASNRYGLTTWLECYGHWGFPGEFLLYGSQSDSIAGEYWSEGTLGDIENRIASSCGHIYGKRKIWSESNTCAGNSFSRSPIDMKQRTDLFFSEGINQSLLHLYVQQPDERVPGFNAWFGNEFNRHNTWFPYLDLFTTYLKRVNYMLQQGTNVADVAYFIGEDAPKMMGATDPPLPKGYQFDFINADILENVATVQDGKLTLPHGTQYKVLVLPKLETMRPELLKKIETLVKEGAIVIGPKPIRSPSLQNQPKADQKVKQIADQLWAGLDDQNIMGKSYGKGFLGQNMTLEQVFSIFDLSPDCQVGDAPLVYCHRTLEHSEIYFLANQSAEPVEAQVTFRCAGREPMFWHPTSGTAEKAYGWKISGSQTTLPVALAPRESVFVVFGQPTDEMSYSLQPIESKELLDITKGWSVAFDSGDVARGPKDPVAFDELSDWIDSDNDAVKYYSGTARYSNEVSIPQPKEGEKMILSLGKVAEMAKVYVNGQYAGGVWTDPYEIEITPFVKDGNNLIEIDVVNTWVNRLIGDARLSESQRKTWAPVNKYTKDSKLKSSGLLGPVRLLAK